jgi:tetratricopeptide (TPR) repeat protein
MPEANPTPIGLPHVVFLERAAREFDSSPGKFGQAAFLVLRLVDLLASSHEPGPQDDLFGYQAAATGRYCNEQLEPGKAAECLQELVRTASYAHRRREPGLIAPAMLTLATHLEDSAHYLEALDVLTTLECIAESGIAPAHAVGGALQRGRVQRKLARFEEAEAAYDQASAVAAAAGDASSVLLSRLGRANVFWGRGNLAEAERCYREVLRDARAAAARDVQARAEHGLGTILGARGQVPDAVPYLWSAYERYEDVDSALRALHDLGLALARLGAVDAAERALKIVVAKAVSSDNVMNAKIEMMHCASFRRDRIGFERWRCECGKDADKMAPNHLADYHLKVGIGLARFSQIDRGAAELQQALGVARAHGLHEFEFRIERILSGLYDSCTTASPSAETPPEKPAWAESISEVTAALAGIAG